MSLTVNALCCDRQGRRILSDVTLGCPRGQALILRGPNGVGKSTLLRAIAGLLPLTSGTVLWEDSNLATDRDGYQEALIYTGHLDAIKPGLTVAENLAFWTGLGGGTAEGGPRQAVTMAIEAFDLTAQRDRLAGTCSAGQKRRLGLARLVLNRRPLWLLDEPTVSLDDASIRAVERLIAQHLAGGGAAVIATHTPLALAHAEKLTLRPPAPADATTDPFLEGSF